MNISNFTNIEQFTITASLADKQYEAENYAQAILFYKKAISILDEKGIVLENDKGRLYNMIALCYKKNKNIEETLKNYAIALKIFEQIPAEKGINVAIIYYNVGVVYTEQNRPIEAVTILKQALVIFEKHTTISQLNIADCYHFLGINYHNSSSFEAAFTAHQKVLAIREKLLGLNDTNTANTYLNIAVVYHEKSQYLNAFIYYQKAGLIYQKNLSPNHFFYRLLQAMYKKTLAAAKKEMLPATIKRYEQWLKDNLPE